MHRAWRSSLLVVAGLVAGRSSMADETAAPAASASAGAAPASSEPAAPATTGVPPDEAAPPASALAVPAPPVPRTNYVPASVRQPDLHTFFNLSLLVRSSPVAVDGKVQEASAKGFRFAEAEVPIGSGGGMIGGGIGVSIVFLNRYIFPTIGLEVLQSVGSRGRVLSGRGGHVLTADSWRTFQVGGTLAGFGVRGRHRRFAGSVLLEPGFIFQSTAISAPGYEKTIEGTAVATSARLLFTGTGCRRLDPELRLCLSVSPHIYAFGLFSGVTLGFRTEIGP